jgi:hypothetical protein
MSGIDLIKYGIGAQDSFQGTGVWSGVKFDRKPDTTLPEIPAPASEDDELGSFKTDICLYSNFSSGFTDGFNLISSRREARVKIVWECVS